MFAHTEIINHSIKHVFIMVPFMLKKQPKCFTKHRRYKLNNLWWLSHEARRDCYNRVTDEWTGFKEPFCETLNWQMQTGSWAVFELTSHPWLLWIFFIAITSWLLVLLDYVLWLMRIRKYKHKKYAVSGVYCSSFCFVFNFWLLLGIIFFLNECGSQ